MNSWLISRKEKRKGGNLGRNKGRKKEGRGTKEGRKTKERRLKEGSCRGSHSRKLFCSIDLFD
jgi:hypothetical protein